MDAIANSVLIPIFNFIRSFVQSYGLSIILFTILFKAILLPLNIAQTKSTVKMQMVQPKLKEIQKKYKSDPKKLQEAQMALYKSEGVNPLAGCLPLLIQLPILWAVYYVFNNKELFAGQYFFGLSLAGALSAAGYIGVIFAIISGGSTFLSTWLLTARNKDAGAGTNPMASNSTNLIMSAFFGWISWSMPVGLVIYWITNNVLQLGIQYTLNKSLRKKAELAASK